MKWRLLFIFLLGGIEQLVYPFQITYISAEFTGSTLKSMTPQEAEFEFLNSTNVSVYIKLGDLDEQTHFYEVEPNSRIISGYAATQEKKEHITYIIFSLHPDPQFAEQSDLYVFNPNKKVYIEAIQDEKGNYIVREQTGTLGAGGTGSFLKYGRKLVGEGARGSLGSTTISGLKLRNSVGSKDILRLPNPFVPYGDRNLEFYNSLRNSNDNVLDVERVFDVLFVDKFEFQDWLEKGKHIGDWTVLHEAALWKFGYVFQYLRDTLGIRETADNNQIMPLDLYYSQDKKDGVLGYFNAIIASYYLSRVQEQSLSLLTGQEYLQKLKDNETLSIPEGIDLPELENTVLKINKAIYGISENWNELKFSFYEKLQDTYIFLACYNLQEFNRLITKFFDTEVPNIIESIKRQNPEDNKKLEKKLEEEFIGPIRGIDNKLLQYFEGIKLIYAQKELGKIIEEYKDSLRKKALNAANEIGKYLVKSSDDLISSFSTNLEKEEPVELGNVYKFIGSDNQEGPALTQEQVKEKIDQKIEKLGYYPGSVRQIQYIMAHKPFYDRYLQGGKNAIDAYYESEIGQNINKIIELIHRESYGLMGIFDELEKVLKN